MNITAEATDDLTLILVKQHLYVDITEDDDLLNSYIAASLPAIENATNAHFLKRDWVSTTKEIEIGLDGTMRLRIPVEPKSVTVTDIIGDTVLEPGDFYFVGDGIFINTLNYDFDTISSVTAVTGTDPIIPEANQARKLIIGDWYAYRENTQGGLSMSESSTNSIKFLLPFLVETSV